MMVSPFEAVLANFSDNRDCYFVDSVYAPGDFVPGPQRANAGWRTRKNQVPRDQCEERGKLRDRLGNTPY
jgi:hypothetical protein